MEVVQEKGKSGSSKIYYIGILLMWLKFYIVSRFYFDLSIENKLQEFILFLSPLSTTLLIYWLLMYASDKWRKRVLVGVNVTLSLILYANVVFYRFFNDFITVPVLFQTNNVGDLGSSVGEMTSLKDIVFFIDVILIGAYLWWKRDEKLEVSKKEKRGLLFLAICVFLLNIGLAEIERPQLLTRTFDRKMLVKNIGLLNYHVYDILMNSKTKVQKAFADGSKLVEIQNYVNANRVNGSEEMKGIAKGKNVIVVSMESLQNFVINNKVAGHEITPFLNQLIKESYYFPNFYHQTGQGKTSDSEFLLENSLYPLPSGAVFFTHAQNTYDALPKILRENGYETAVFHANNKSFWNRDVMYESLKYKHFYHQDYFDVNKENSIGWGLKDDAMFEQSIKYVKSLKQPFYIKYITLTNHFPFTLEKKDEYIPEWTSDDGTVNRYFTTVRFMDESLKKFFDLLKKEGIYQNSIIILYGDHYGISENHNKAMSEYLGKEITPFETVQLQRVPLIIHIPGQKGAIIDTVGGQIDLKPTILNLLGIDTKDKFMFGHDLFSKERKDFVVLRDGSFVTKDYVYTRETCYDKKTGIAVDKKLCEPYQDKAKKELEYSDKVIYGDLLRFLKEDLNDKNTKVDRNKGTNVKTSVESEMEMETLLKKEAENK